jgi:leucyl aminopeptidase
MEIDVTASALGEIEAQTLAFAVADPASDLPAPGRELDGLLGGRLARLAEAGDLRTEPWGVCVLHVNGELRAERVVASGLGKAGAVDSDALRTAAAAVVRAESPIGGTLAWALDDSLPLPLAEQARAVADGVILGGYDPGRWKTGGDRRPKPVERLVLAGADDEAAEAGRRAGLVAEWANRARDLENRPPNDLTPERLAERAAEIASASEHVTAEALGPAEIEKLGMGAFAAVAQGSHNPPRLIVLRYEPPSPARADLLLGLVGKAITFDTGGISLKPADGMDEMKGDMGGGAAVVEGLGAIADLGLPVRTLAVIAAAENMPGGHAFRPGDILTAANGKTIEITNTDAEGRLVLADALWYAREQGATHVADLATLTGAMAVALGDLYAGVFANDEEWRGQIVEAGEASGDHIWPFPLHRRYRRFVDSTYADMKNSSSHREAGAALAAEFLQEFAGEGPWAHLDIAGTAFLSRARGDYLWQPGGTGYGVRLLVELATRLAAG